MARNIRAQRGDVLRCQGWRQESILRMLENNLENGEDPENLVIYTGARAARSWPDYDRIVGALKELEADETLVCQSGRAVAKFRSHARAPRVVMANGNVLGRWGNPDQFFELEQKGLTAKPGMTAAAWQYIGSQGILQGTYQSFMGAGQQFFGGDLRGRLVADRRLRRHGRRAAAGRQARGRRHPRGGALARADRAPHRLAATATGSRETWTKRWLDRRRQGVPRRALRRPGRQRRRNPPGAARARRRPGHRHRPDCTPTPTTATCPPA